MEFVDEGLVDGLICGMSNMSKSVGGWFAGDITLNLDSEPVYNVLMDIAIGRLVVFFSFSLTNPKINYECQNWKSPIHTEEFHLLNQALLKDELWMMTNSIAGCDACSHWICGMVMYFIVFPHVYVGKHVCIHTWLVVSTPLKKY